MAKIKVNVSNPYYMEVPEWFMKNRFNGITSFSETEQCWIANEIPDYTSIKNFMLNFPKTSVFLDVGAQMGLSALPIAAEGYKVLAIEPVSSNLKMLMKNLEISNLKERVILFPYAAHSSEETDIVMFVPSEEDCASLSESAANRIGKPVHEEKVRTIVLDKAIQTYEKDVHFIKIDVQGAEIDVLRGLKETLKKPTHRYVYMEWDPKYMEDYGSTPEELHSFMNSVGYMRIQPNQESHAFNGDALYTNVNNNTNV